jgi:hypothetical protein
MYTDPGIHFQVFRPEVGLVTLDLWPGASGQTGSEGSHQVGPAFRRPRMPAARARMALQVNTFYGCYESGTGVLIFIIFLPKNAFSTLNYAKLCKNLIKSLGFLTKTPIFSPKIVESCRKL